MKHLIPSICLAFLAFISACGGGNDSESSNPYDGVPESLQELIGDVSMSWSYTQNGEQKQEAIQFNYSKSDVNGEDLVKKVSSQYTLACSGQTFVVTGSPSATCRLSPSSLSDGLFAYDIIDLYKIEQTASNVAYFGRITNESGLDGSVRFTVTAPKS